MNRGFRWWAGGLAREVVNQLCEKFKAWRAAGAKPVPKPKEKPHRLVVQLGTRLTDPDTKTHDRVAVDAGHPLDAADRAALAEGADCHFLFLLAEHVSHGIGID